MSSSCSRSPLPCRRRCRHRRPARPASCGLFRPRTGGGRRRGRVWRRRRWSRGSRSVWRPATADARCRGRPGSRLPRRLWRRPSACGRRPRPLVYDNETLLQRDSHGHNTLESLKLPAVMFLHKEPWWEMLLAAWWRPEQPFLNSSWPVALKTPTGVQLVYPAQSLDIACS